jgi:hypothetical protein
MNPSSLSRRSFIRGTSVSLALPFLDAMLPRFARGEGITPPKRMVFACASLGIYGPSLYPKETGANYSSTPYLDILKEHRNDFTLFSGVSHPDQNGADGHSSQMTWLTSARGPGLGGFRNTISIDQYVAEKIGFETRYPSLVLTTSGQSSQSYTRSGVMVPGFSKPSQVFAKLFLDGTALEIQTQMQKLKEGQSIMDTVQEEAKRFGRRVGAADKEKLDEYFTSVREMEQRMHKAEAWVQKPKPKVDAQAPQDVTNESDLIARMRLLYDLVPLALQTDSTRAITILVQGRGDVIPVPGVTIDHHNLSHHGQDPLKIDQLQRIESEQFKAYRDLLTSLKAKKEAGGNLLDNTMVVFGSNLGNANSHDWHNLPLVMAGGGFKHGQHIAYDAKNNQPMSNLFVQMLHRMGLETEEFGSSTATALPGFV